MEGVRARALALCRAQSRQVAKQEKKQEWEASERSWGGKQTDREGSGQRARHKGTGKEQRGQRRRKARTQAMGKQGGKNT